MDSPIYRNKYQWCPKLQICYEEACYEINQTPEQNYTNFATYPRYIFDFVSHCSHEKSIDYCFLGAFSFTRGQSIGYNNRRWIIDFSKKHFTSDSIFVNTTKDHNLHNPWELLGDFDKTNSETNLYTAPKYMENKNHFDKLYYQTMCKSKFCLCPAGDLMWSMRFYEALLCKSIPIVQCHEETYRNELEMVIPYKYYINTEKEFIYRTDWADFNYSLFIKYHML